MVVVLVLVVGGTLLLIAGLVVATALALAWLALERWLPGIRGAEALKEIAQTPESVAALPASPDFAIALPGGGPTPRTGSTDSPDATRFKEALSDSAELQQALVA